MTVPSIGIVGAGIAGLAAAEHLARAGDVAVMVFERDSRVGGKLVATPFAGLDSVDESADAFLARIPDAVDLAATVGISASLHHPEAVGAAVWHHGLHDIPDGLVLGLPGRLRPLATSRLLSWRGKARAAIEPLLLRQSLSHDAVGSYVRGRFGDEVHERLVDALVGSIYATDTDDFSLAEIPQLAALSNRHRSALIAARQQRAIGPATAAAGAIFAAPKAGVGTLATATAKHAVRHGAELRLGHAVGKLTKVARTSAATSTQGWDVDGTACDAVIVATPAHAAASLLRPVASGAASGLDASETADVILVTLHVDQKEWPDRLIGRSGYLVPKPVQRTVTAVSFGSQKWAHWAPPTGGQILRVSLGRDGQPVMHLSDGEIIERVLDDLALHLDVRFTPLDVRISRWPGAFAQYRPGHRARIDAIDAALPPGIFLAGSAYRGIGVPACIRDGRTIGERAATYVRALQ